MKLAQRFSFFIIVLTLVSCSGEDEKLLYPPINKAPSPPQLIAPQSDLACTYSTLTFEWKPSKDPEGTDVQYKLEVSERSDFHQIYKNAETGNTFFTLDVKRGSTYYWRVLSIDEEGLESDPSEIRSFFTEPTLTYNSIPQNPSSENPLNNTTVDESLSLIKWTSLDADGDILRFDVYFGTTNPPLLIYENLKDTLFEVDLSEATTYFWQIIAKDSKEAKAIGPIWKFNVN